jgi:hypothetical protein
MWYIIITILIVWLIVCVYYLFTKNDKEHFIDIDNIYKDLSGFTGSSHEKYNVTYGEITIDGIDNIVTYLKENNIERNIFIDLGCGIGKSLVMAKMKGYDKAIGVELIKERYDIARVAYDKLDSEYKKNIEIYNNDLFEEERIKKLNINKPVTVFVSNLLFDIDMNIKLFEHLSNILPNNSIIIVSKQPNKLPENIKEIGNIKVPMTWTKDSNCYIYKLTK